MGRSSPTRTERARPPMRWMRRQVPLPPAENGADACRHQAAPPAGENAAPPRRQHGRTATPMDSVRLPRKERAHPLFIPEGFTREPRRTFTAVSPRIDIDTSRQTLQRTAIRFFRPAGCSVNIGKIKAGNHPSPCRGCVIRRRENSYCRANLFVACHVARMHQQQAQRITVREVWFTSPACPKVARLRPTMPRSIRRHAHERAVI